MNLRRISAVCATVALSLSPAALSAQAPVAHGTAAGWGGIAAAEARLGPAVLWNPALIGLPDVRPTSLTLLGVYGEAGDNTHVPAFAAAARIGSFAGWEDAAQQRSMMDRTTYGDFLQIDARTNVLWAAGHVGETGFAVTTDAFEARSSTDRGLLIAAGEPLEPLTQSEFDLVSSGRNQYGSVTTLLLSRSLYLGHVPFLGHVWGGLAGKHARIHRFARGAATIESAGMIERGVYDDSASAWVQNPDAEGLLYTFNEVRGVQVWGSDLGLVFNPSPATVVGISAANIYQNARLPSEGVYRRSIWSLGAGNGPAGLHSTEGLADVAAMDSVGRAALEKLVDDAHLPRVLRVAGVTDFGRLRVGASAAQMLERGDAMGYAYEGRWNVGASMPGLKYRPRVSVGQRMDGTAEFSFGGERSTCGGTTGFSAQYRFGETQGLGLGVSYAFGDRARCGLRR